MNVQVQAAPVKVPAVALSAFVAKLFAATGLPVDGGGDSCEWSR